MPKYILPVKHENNFLLALLKKTGQILIAIGSPPLFAIKLLLWTLAWIGNSCFKLADILIFLIVKTSGTFLWLIRTALLSHNILINSLPARISSLYSVIKQTFRKNISRLYVKPKKGRRITTRSATFTSQSPLQLITNTSLVVRNFLNKIQVPQIKITLPHIYIPLPTLRSKKTFRISLTLILIAFFLIFIPFQIYQVLHDLPNPQLLASQSIPVTTKIYDRNGILLYEFYKNQNRTPINISSLPKHVINATVATEDKNFYSHPGFDLEGIARAAIANSNGEINQGGSTITQQLVRFVLLSQEQTITRKIREVILAFWAEQLYSKNQILTMYLNDIPYGGSAYGIEAASQTVFDKHAKDLTLAQAALLAGLPSAPTTYSPFGPQPQLAIQRQHQVLNSMVTQGLISKNDASDAKNEPLKFAQIETEIKAPHFVMYVHDLLAQKYGQQTVDQGGLQVVTTLDYNLYQKVNKTLQDEVAKQQYLNVGNGAVLITNPKTGEILSMNGSTDFFDIENDGNVNVTISPRSPGSSIKPLNYALGFEKGVITPSTIINDSPTTYNFPGSPSYSPLNYDNRFHGRVTTRVALGSSYNIPAVKILERNGLINFIQFATNLGITTFTDPSRYGLSLTLGGGEVKMTDMATAYSAFANQGKKVNLNPIIQIKDYRGNLIEDKQTQTNFDHKQVLSARTAFIISSILADDQARTPAFGPGSYLNIPGHTVAVKTGTAQDKRDNWTIGYSFGPDPKLVAVWVGNNDNSPMSPYLESGNTGAAAIWNPIMRDILKDKQNSPVPRPDDLIEVRICALTGTLPCENCPFVTTEYFTRGTEPKTACSISKEDLERYKNLQNPVNPERERNN